MKDMFESKLHAIEEENQDDLGKKFQNLKDPRQKPILCRNDRGNRYLCKTRFSQIDMQQNEITQISTIIRDNHVKM